MPAVKSGWKRMFVKIGDVEFTKSNEAWYTVTKYGGGSIGIRARVQPGNELKLDEAKLYKLREGRTEEIEILTEDGNTIKGLYKINELNWKKERTKEDTGDFQLVFNIGLQQQ
jgi:hypothetical protein